MSLEEWNKRYDVMLVALNVDNKNGIKGVVMTENYVAAQQLWEGLEATKSKGDSSAN